MENRLVKYLVVLLSTIVKFAMFFNTDTGLKQVILHWSGKKLWVASHSKYVTQL